MNTNTDTHTHTNKTIGPKAISHPYPPPPQTYAMQFLDGIGAIPPHHGHEYTPKGPLSHQALGEVPRAVAQLAVGEHQGTQAGGHVHGGRGRGLALRGGPRAHVRGQGALEHRHEGGRVPAAGTAGLELGLYRGLERGLKCGGRCRDGRLEGGGAKRRRGGDAVGVVGGRGYGRRVGVRMATPIVVRWGDGKVGYVLRWVPSPVGHPGIALLGLVGVVNRRGMLAGGGHGPIRWRVGEGRRIGERRRIGEGRRIGQG